MYTHTHAHAHAYAHDTHTHARTHAHTRKIGVNPTGQSSCSTSWVMLMPAVL